jgi:hypothetical protein
MKYDQNDCQQFYFITPRFPDTSKSENTPNTLKIKVGDVVGYIFEIEYSVGGFLILKQIIYILFQNFEFFTLFESKF